MKVNVKVKKSVLWSLRGIENVQVESGEQKLNPDLAEELIGAGLAKEVEKELTEEELTEIKSTEQTKEYIEGFEKHCIETLNNHELSSIDIDKILTEVNTEQVPKEIHHLIDPFVEKLNDKKSKILLVEKKESDLNTGLENLKKDRESFESEKKEFKKAVAKGRVKK